ncbi:MAG: hypothetical protein FJ288_10935 [Planctomycetes bacterium]|nr:hypothetical protein [Planctomycetota bacterium]
MTRPLPQTEDQEQAAPAPLIRVLAGVMLVLPAAGLLVNLAAYLLLPADWAVQYVRGVGVRSAIGIAFVNLVGNWFHYRYTRMGLDVVGRILTYCWILSGLLLMLYWVKGLVPPAP